MGKITVSRVGARFVHHVDKEKFADRVIKDEKKTVKKKVYKEEQQELENIGTELPVDIEDENLDGVSV